MVQGVTQQDCASLTQVAVLSNARAWAFGVRALLAVLAGLGLAWSVCWPFAGPFTQGQPVWWLQLLAQAVLLMLLRSAATAAMAFRLAGFYTVSWLCATFWWLYIALHVYGGLAALLSVLAVLALAAALATYYGVAARLWWTLREQTPARQALLFSALWTLAEMARGTWLTGFGWGATGYAQLDGPLAWWIPLLGSYGVGGLAAWCAATLALLPVAAWWHRGLWLAVLLLGSVLPAIEYTHPAGSLSVALLQGNIPQDEKFDTGTGVPLALHWYAKNMQQEQAQLVLAPETAIPLLPQDLPPGYWEGLQKQVAMGHTALMTGIPLGRFEQGYTNSVIALQPGLAPLRYDKHHLVPFGEFIPPLFKWFTRMMNIPLGDFNRGAVGQASFAIQGQRVAANICYEDLFGEELGARFLEAGREPTVFANVSNLGWFGDTVAIDQHLQISRMRALEFQRPFVRATNTGATVIINHHAEVVQALPRLTQGVLRGTVQGQSGTTPYAWWVARFGLWPLWLVAGLVLAWTYRTHRMASTAT